MLSELNFKRDPDSAPTHEEKQAWRRLAKAFLAEAVQDDAENDRTQAKAKPQKMQRISAYRHLVALDHQLLAIGIDGLNTFVYQRPLRQPSRWPLLWINEDQPLVNLSAQNYLLFEKQLLLWVNQDPFDRVWNDVQDAISVCGLSFVTTAVGITHSLSFGPWQGQTWFAQLCEGAQHMKGCMAPDDPLLSFLLERILADLGHFGGGGMDAESVLVNLFEARFLDIKGPRSAPSRWFSWRAAHVFWGEHWYSRLAVLVFTGLHIGYLSRRGGEAMLKNLTARTSKMEASTGAAKQQIQRMRDRCHNTLHLNTVIMSEPMIRQSADLSCNASEPLHRWHQRWTHFARDREGCASMLWRWPRRRWRTSSATASRCPCSSPGRNARPST